MLASNTEWKRWGEKDPLWAAGVWHGRQRDGPNPWTDTDFYAAGRLDWAEFRSRWERYGLNYESCVEVGSGAGRITAPLVHDFKIVHGVDVSPAMLDYAKSRVPAARLFVTDGVHIPIDDSSVTAAFSSQVLQCLDSLADAIPIFSELHRVLRPGSSMMIHLPIYTCPWGAFLYRRLFAVWQWGARQRARVYRRLGLPLMRYTWYEAGWLRGILQKRGFQDIEFITFSASAGYLHSFVLARKASGTSQSLAK